MAHATADPVAPTAAPAVAPPARLEVPGLGLAAPVDPMGIAGDGQMALPEDVDRVGWYRFGPEPGAAGSGPFPESSSSDPAASSIDGAPGHATGRRRDRRASGTAAAVMHRGGPSGFHTSSRGHRCTGIDSGEIFTSRERV